METIYFAGGCLWGVQEFMRHLPGVHETEAGRANGTRTHTSGPYDGYAECVRTTFEPDTVTIQRLMDYFFEIIDPYALDRQGPDIGRKYRTGVYSADPNHLREARAYIANRTDHCRIAVEIALLTNYVCSDEAHQDRLTRFPETPCHLPRELLFKYR